MEGIVAATILLCIWAIGDIVSNLTRATISSLLVVSILLLIWFLVGFPREIIVATGFIPVGTIFVGILITAIGSEIDFDELKKHPKIVLITVVGVLAAMGILILIGQPLLGKEYTLAGTPIVAGASTVTMVMVDGLTSLGRDDLVIFVLLTFVLQNLIGIPAASFVLKKSAHRFKDNYSSIQQYSEDKNHVVIEEKSRLVKIMERFESPGFVLAKLSLVTLLAHYLSILTGFNYYITALILGFVFTRLKLLDEGSLSKTQCSELIMILIMYALFSSFDTVDIETLGNIALPMSLLLVLGAICCCISGYILSKPFKLDPFLSMGLCLTCMLGFPTTVLIPSEVARSLAENAEQEAALSKYMVPKMVIAGLSTSFVSLAVAAITLKML